MNKMVWALPCSLFSAFLVVCEWRCQFSVQDGVVYAVAQIILTDESTNAKSRQPFATSPQYLPKQQQLLHILHLAGAHALREKLHYSRQSA